MISNDPPENVDDQTEAVFVEALEHRKSGRPDKVIELLGSIDVTDGARVNILIILADAYSSLGQYRHAIDTLSRAVGLRPKHAIVTEALFNTLADADELDAAIAEARRFLEYVDSGEARRAPQVLVNFYREMTSEQDFEVLRRELRTRNAARFS